ncbi:hypothetical protein ACQ4M4_11380 [Leptolyngbya sp. AN02str]|uniref:hypothetical protein n=1 Tax=Leptolyngbya sp. AN02str TaxID=3423363 RepID=UPI003D315130
MGISHAKKKLQILLAVLGWTLCIASAILGALLVPFGAIRQGLLMIGVGAIFFPPLKAPELLKVFAAGFTLVFLL